MRIDTTNHGGTRFVPRADKPLFPQYIGYRFMASEGPTLTVTLEGFDGRKYTVMLTDADCDAIKMAREKYAEEFAQAGQRKG